MKNTTICLILLVYIGSCKPDIKKTENARLQKTNANNKVQNLSVDSTKLLVQLKKFPKTDFPFKSEDANSENGFYLLNLSEFNNKKLFNIPFKKIPTQIGGGMIDNDEDDSTFNLVDLNYKAEWKLLAKRANFFVIVVNSGNGIKLVTQTFNLNVIDAINIEKGDPASNPNFSAYRHSVIYKDLTILIIHEYSVRIDEENNFDEKTEKMKWFISDNGTINKAI